MENESPSGQDIDPTEDPNAKQIKGYASEPEAHDAQRERNEKNTD